MATQMFNERYPCPLCKRLHSIRECTQFLVLPIPQRRREVDDLHLCRNCLAQSHQRPDCPSLDRCVICKKNHHSLVHPMAPGQFWFQMTALPIVVTEGKRPKEMRILIDPTYNATYITLAAVERHGCVVRHGYTNIKLKHRLYDRPPVEFRCVVVNKDYRNTPAYDINRDWASGHPITVQNNAADKWWFRSWPYFMIIGRDQTHKVFQGGGAIGKAGETYLQHSIFGLLYFGPAKPADYDQKKFDRDVQKRER